MEATTRVKLKSLAPYRDLFPKAKNIDHTVKMGASVSDTVAFIPKVIRSTAWQVEKYVRQELSGLTPYGACEKLWYFVKYHIKYEADARGIEMVRSPRRFIADAKGDCDCGSTYIGACIFSLSSMIAGIRSVTLRITKYKKDYFQHIYPIVELADGTRIIMDFVVDRFNYEEPYTEKQDYNMELQYLDGIDDEQVSLPGTNNEDPLSGDSALTELGKLLKKGGAKKSSGGGGGIFKKKTPEKKQAAKEKRKKVGKKLLKVANIANKVNPGTALLRAGILAAMKTNLMKVAESLRWGYASRELAQAKGMDMSKYDKLKAVLDKTEKIFYGAGGKPDNLKKAILTGRGNRDHAVSGVEDRSDNVSISELLGEVYHDEFVSGLEGIEGFDGFGAVAAGAAVAAASSAIGALAALIKSIGNLFPGKKKKEGNDESPGDDGEGSTVPDPGPRDEPEDVAYDQESTSQESGAEPSENLPVPSEAELPVPEEAASEPVESDTETTEGLTGIGSGIKNFYQKHKKWFVPVGVVVVTIGAIALIDHYASKTKPLIEPHYQPVNGPPGKRGKQRKGGKKGKAKKHEVIALM